MKRELEQDVGRRISPFGSWSSPITAELVAQAGVALDAVQVRSGAVYWLERRPEEHGRNVLVRWEPGVAARDCVPAGFDVRSRVHEYGGGAYLVTASVLYFCNDADQRVYRVATGGTPEPITPEPPTSRAWRYADLQATPDGRLLICVRERHEPDGDVVNELVAFPADGSADPRLVASGHDFYSFPRPSTDGRQLAWTCWDQPQMPWDGTDLWVAELDPDGRLSSARKVAGGPDESIFQPAWSPDGVLHFVSDRSGWWNLYRDRAGRVEPLAPMEAEFGEPQWEFGYSTYAFTGGRIACRYQVEGAEYLGLLDPATGGLAQLPVPFTEIKPYLASGDTQLVFIAAGPLEPPAVVLLELTNGRLQLLAGGGRPVDARYISRPQPIVFPTERGRTAHALYYPPTNPDEAGPVGERPPLIVRPHSGPTSKSKRRLDLEIQFFTSRGLAVVDVDYGGSTGYGRAYRERLTGQWGVVDVEDCLNAARHLARAGEVNELRLVISGKSAGGFTALSALAFHELFGAGVSHYGITDLETQRRETHKFQAHELDRLIGPYPQMAERYRERSPLHAADRFTRPLLLLQGRQDPIVPPSQAEQLITVLREKRIPHVYLLFDGEGHGFSHPAVVQRVLEAELSFYSDALGFRGEQ